MQSIHQFLSSRLRTALRGSLRTAAVLCAMVCLPLLNVQAETHNAAVYEGETLLWRCGAFSTAATHADPENPLVDFLKLSLKAAPITVNKEHTICDGETLLWRCLQLTSEGTYRDTDAYAGFPYLDSAYYVLKLNVISPIATDAEEDVICPNGTYTWEPW